MDVLLNLTVYGDGVLMDKQLSLGIGGGTEEWVRFELSVWRYAPLLCNWDGMYEVVF
jgi:hypothetical protein